MSTEENKHDLATNQEATAPASQAMPEVIIDRVKNEVTITDPVGKSLTLKTKIIEEESEEDLEELELMTPAIPLSPRSIALKKLMDSWMDENVEEQADTWGRLKVALEENRPSNRKLFS